VRPDGRRAHHGVQVRLDRRDVDGAARVPDEAQRFDETWSLHFNAGGPFRFAFGHDTSQACCFKLKGRAPRIR
jgi:hypothetical protein